jgi:putative acetyltransferase
MYTNPVILRRILPSDNQQLAAIIRAALVEFGANHQGTVYYDESTDHLSDLFEIQKSVYFVALIDSQVVGGGGLFPTSGLPHDTCELVKMYLLPEFRGKGIGSMLLEQCLSNAKAIGYKKVYLESMPELAGALAIYEKFGFQYLQGPLGNTGHFGCERWMLKSLD